MVKKLNPCPVCGKPYTVVHKKAREWFVANGLDKSDERVAHESYIAGTASTPMVLNAEYRAKQRELGLCETRWERCNNPVEPGKHQCETHLAKAREYSLEYRQGRATT